ncbi:MAG: ChaN family lipoprotein [Burkholderiales bacterium]|nr:ChaN family lipoprotein [Burkholderiales bacterium]
MPKSTDIERSTTGRAARTIGLIAAAALVATIAQSAPAHEGCVPEGEWAVPGGGRIAAQEILARAANARVVLLGETHDDPDHHRWELHTLAALATLHPKLMIGFEMFPRRVQPALDRWVAGKLNEAEFLKASDWSQVWGYDADFYLPLFHFARMHRIPMIALNVERDFVRTVGAKGLAAVPSEKREGVTDPAAASEAYLARLFDAYSKHPEKNKTSAPARTDPEFGRFVEAQLVWDRAMAQALADAATRNPNALVVGVMGARHVAHGDGVPHQLESLGVQRVVSLLPWDHEADCDDYTAGLASAVYGLPYMPPEPVAPPPQLLGIRILPVPDGIRVVAVSPDSIAAAAGLQADDVLTEAAGTHLKTPEELKSIVVRTAPGTWLPLKAKRGGEPIELTAKFPPAK